MGELFGICFLNANLKYVFRYNNSSLYKDGVDNLDDPPEAFIVNTATNPIGFPSGLGGNACLVIQQYPANTKYSAQLAFSFGSNKLAIRRRNNEATWSEWAYVTFS